MRATPYQREEIVVGWRPRRQLGGVFLLYATSSYATCHSVWLLPLGSLAFSLPSSTRGEAETVVSPCCCFLRGAHATVDDKRIFRKIYWLPQQEKVTYTHFTSTENDFYFLEWCFPKAGFSKMMFSGAFSRICSVEHGARPVPL